MSNKRQQFHKTQKFELPGEYCIYNFPGAESIFPSSTFNRVTPTRNKKTKNSLLNRLYLSDL